MSTRWRSGAATVALVMVSCAPLSRAQGHLILDSSGSMAGFAQASGPRLRGFVERLHGALSVAGPEATKTALISQDRNGTNRFAEVPLKSFAAAAANAATYRNDTPLQWSIEQARQKDDEFLIVTDGMETGARLNGVIATLSELANTGWGIGLAATFLPFKGTFYTEMEIVLKDDLPKIAEAVHAANPKWQVAKIECPNRDRQNCYYFDGDRPLLMILFSKSGDLGRLYSAVATALTDNHLDSTRILQLSPFRAIDTITALRPTDSTAKRLLSLPDLSKGESEIRCLANGQKLGFDIVTQPSSALKPPQPSEINLINVDIDKRPAWVSQPRQFSQAGAQTTVPLEVTCTSGLLDRLSPSTYVVQKGELQVRFQQTWSNAASGWWLDWDAANPWQYPHKVYKLAEVVQAVHRSAMEKAHKAKPPVTLVTLKASGPR